MRRILIFSAAAVLSLAQGCSMNEQTDMTEGRSGVIEINLYVQEHSVSKAVPQVSEAMVHDINLFMYDESGDLECFLYSGNPGSILTLEADPDLRHYLYAVANVGDITAVEATKSRQGLLSMIWSADSPEDIAGRQGELPMAGSAILEQNPESLSVSLPLRRLLAKFRVIVDTSDLDPDVSMFDITQVRLRNMNRNVGFFSPGKALSADDVFGTGLTEEGFGLAGIYTEGVDFYIPENIQGDLLSGNTDERAHIPPDPYGDLCTYVEFTVRYRSSTRYNNNLIYRYYLHDGKNMDNFDLMRNTMYTCRTAFTGSGINEDTWRIDVSGMRDLVTSVSVSPETVTFMYEDETAQFTAEVLPVTAESREVGWRTTDRNVATVSDDGLVSVVGDGTCSIIATARDGSGKADTSEVISYIESKFFKLVELPSTVYPGIDGPITVEYECFPDGIPEITMKNTSLDERCAVLENGVITISNPDGKQGRLGVFRVTGELHGIVSTSAFTVNGGNVDISRNAPTSIYEGESAQIELRMRTPLGVQYTWSSSDPEVAEITPDGTVTGVRAGSCRLKVITQTGARDSMDFTVLPAVVTSLEGDNRVVNTFGLTEEGRDWSGLTRTLQIEKVTAPGLETVWEVRDSDGNLSNDILISPDGLINPCSFTANGAYTIICWDKDRRFHSEPLTIEVYNLVEYEVGLEGYKVAYTSSHGVYMITFSTRIDLESWRSLNDYEREVILRYDIITYPDVFRQLNHLGGYDTPHIFINTYYCGKWYTGEGVLEDLEGGLSTFGYLLTDYTDEESPTIAGHKGTYYKFPSPEDGSDSRSWFFIKEKEHRFFNRDEYIGLK